MIGIVAIILGISMVITYVYAQKSVNFINTSSLYGKITDEYITLGKVLIWVVFVLLIVNLVIVIAKLHKIGIAFVIVYSIIILLMVTCGGIHLRKTKILQKATLPPLCYAMLNDAHMNSIKDFCPKKYTTTGIACAKGYVGSSWETTTDSSIVKNMNPSCCHPVVNYYTYDLMIFGLSMFLNAIL